MARIYLSPPDISPQDHASLNAVLKSNWVAPAGPHLNEFESAICERTGRAHAIALNSGTAALHLALQLIGVGPGDTVICPSLTFAATANPICYLGANPVFVDSEMSTWNMDPEKLEEALASETKVKAVIVVHLYGQCANMDPILELCKSHEVPLIEDAAEALGACYKGRPAGSMGDLSFFSFNGNKIITTSGGGMLLCDRADLSDQALYLATQAREPVTHYEHKAVGYNYRMSNLLAGLGLSQIKDLDRRISIRRRHFESYTEALGDLPGIKPMPILAPDDANYWLSCITIDPTVSNASRDDLIYALEREDIEARPLWKPLHLQPVFSKNTCYGGVVAKNLFEYGLCLPSGSSMTKDGRSRVVRAIREAIL
jgi:pyridoxal phosphate-dependent aminotransferase EpsN